MCWARIPDVYQAATTVGTRMQRWTEETMVPITVDLPWVENGGVLEWFKAGL